MLLISALIFIVQLSIGQENYSAIVNQILQIEFEEGIDGVTLKKAKIDPHFSKSQLNCVCSNLIDSLKSNGTCVGYCDLENIKEIDFSYTVNHQNPTLKQKSDMRITKIFKRNKNNRRSKKLVILLSKSLELCDGVELITLAKGFRERDMVVVGYLVIKQNGQVSVIRTVCSSIG